MTRPRIHLTCFLTSWLVASVLLAQQPIVLTAAPGSHEIEPGVFANVWMYNGQFPGPTIRLTEGERLKVRFVNAVPDLSTVHFHGLHMPVGMDGVPHFARPPVEQGQEFTYEFDTTQAGTHFYHSHVGHQLEKGLHGMVILDPAGPGDLPYDKEWIVDMDDWYQGPIVGGFTHPIYTHYLITGKTSLGQTPFLVDQGDVVRIRFLNSSSATNYAVALDGHPMLVTHTDGNRVIPVSVDALRIGAGERYDVYVTANNPGNWSLAVANLLLPSTTIARAVMRYNGTPYLLPPPAYNPPALTIGQYLEYSTLESADPSTAVAVAPDRTYNLALDVNPTAQQWLLGGEAHPNSTPLDVVQGEDVRIVMPNVTPVPHPMHLHGHAFRLHGSANPANPPLKDTVLVPGSGTSTFDFIANAPGRWPFHCHNIYHAAAGMFRTVKYINGDADGDGLADDVDMEPTQWWPVLSVDPMGGGFLPGSTVSLDVQWPVGTTALYFYGLEQAWPNDWGMLGRGYVSQPVFGGTAVSAPGDTASLVTTIPAVPGLQFRAALQALVTAPALPLGLRVSMPAVINVN